MEERDALECAADALDSLLRRECAAQGLEYSAVRGRLQFRWMRENLNNRIEATRETEAPFTEILVRALRCQRGRDSTGYRLACLEWLKARHGVQPGDTVVLGGWSKPRTVRVEDFTIALAEDNLSQHSFLWFEGPCLSHRVHGSNPESHGQAITDTVHKVN